MKKIEFNKTDQNSISYECNFIENDCILAKWEFNTKNALLEAVSEFLELDPS